MRPDPDAKQRRKPGPRIDSGDQDQEQEGANQEQNKDQNQLQNKLGNQGVAAMIAGRGGPQSAGQGGIALEAQLAPIHEGPEKEGPGLGGDDDPVDDGLLTLADLTRSWNPGIGKGKDKPAFLESMPDDELPPEDAGFLARVLEHPDRFPIGENRAVDRLLQPTPAVVAASLAHWTQAVTRWAGTGLVQRALCHLIQPSAPLLQDRYGRVLHARSRAGSIAVWTLLDCPALQPTAGPEAAAAIAFCLELEGRRHRMHNIRIDAAEGESALPLAAAVFLANVRIPEGESPPRPPSQALGRALWRSLVTLVDLEDADGLVPALADPVPEEPDPDDPLDIDAILRGHTGGDATASGSFHAAIQAAERLAAAASRSRVQFAGACAIVADVAQTLASTPTTTSLHAILGALDQEVNQSLQLLVEIARAAQKQSVPPSGLRNGLRRVARWLNRLRGDAQKRIVELIAGLLPDVDHLPLPPAIGDDPLSLAHRAGTPSEALDALEALPPGIDRDAAIVMTRASAGHDPAEMLGGFLAVKEAAARARRPFLAAAASTCEGACRLHIGDLEGALAVAQVNLQFSLRRHNGLGVAEAALLAMEALTSAEQHERAARLRLDAGRALHTIGALAGLSVLARWSPDLD